MNNFKSCSDFNDFSTYTIHYVLFCSINLKTLVKRTMKLKWNEVKQGYLIDIKTRTKLLRSSKKLELNCYVQVKN